MAEREPILDPLLGELADGVCMADGSGRILYLNAAAERLLEVPLDEARGKSLCDLLCGHLALSGTGECAAERCPLREGRQKAATFLGRYGPKFSFEWRQPHIRRVERWKDLRVRAMSLATPWLDSEEAEKCFAIVEDVSAEVELERRKEDWRKMIAHDLRSPLLSLYANLRVIEAVPAGTALGAQERGLVDLSVRACRKILELLNLYLDVSKLEAGLMPVSARELPLLGLAAACAAELSPLARSRNIQVAVEVPADSRVRADPALLARVVQNLLDNALKYTREGGRVVLKGVGEEGPMAGLSVEDDGIGIAPEDLPLIFDRFYQARARREGRIQGNGLGLTFCWEAMKAMGGEIAVRSKLGSGSEFVIRLPRAG